MQKKSQIVIVEDDKDLCAGLCKLLKKWVLNPSVLT